MRFQESLSCLIELAVAHNVPIDNSTVVIRDGAGRLLLAREEIEKKDVLAKALRETLVGYLSPAEVLSGPAVVRLLQDPLLRAVSINVGGQTYTFSYGDRRVVGMDWMLSPAPEFAGTKRLVFGSLKGGVGRSTALAVFAADLARNGKRVLAIDLDLEAPGIGSMLLPSASDEALDRRPRFGVIDYLVENGINGVSDDEMYDFIGVSTFHDGSIDVLPAVGRETDQQPECMIAKLSRALVEDYVEGSVISLSSQVREMVDRFAGRSHYDVILVDARAGLAEITAAPLIGLGAELLLFGTDQPQTFRGYSYMLANLMHMSRPEQFQSDDWRQRLTFVQSKAPSSAAKRAAFEESLYELCAKHLYDSDSLDAQGYLIPGDFSPSPTERGIGVPHDATHIQYHPDYDAFDPISDVTQLQEDVYAGPFGAFLNRAWAIAEIDRTETN